MSLYDKASLVQIPSGYKSGTLYSVLPANGNGDFTHTRASSATRVNKDGLIESIASGVPRLDYPLIDGVAQDCPALLLEPSRTNLLTYSEDFSNAVWAKSNTTITSNDVISPDGSQTADLCNYTIGGSYINTGFASSGNTDVTVSVFVKANTVSVFRIRESFYIGSSCVYDLTAVSAGSGGTIENYGNGWYKCSFTYNLGVGQNNINFIFDLNTNVGSVYLWGAQCELGSYPTSYIPTTSSTVTRSADVCNGAGTSAEFNDSEGVLFAEIAALANDGTNRRIAIPNTGVTGLHRIELSSTDNKVFGVTYISPSNQAAISYTMPNATTPFKMAYKYKENDFALWVDGFQRGTDPSGSVPTGLVKLNFDDGSGGNDFYGKTKQLMVFNEALTDSELEQITSWTSFDEMAKGQLYTVY